MLCGGDGDDSGGGRSGGRSGGGGEFEFGVKDVVQEREGVEKLKPNDPASQMSLRDDFIAKKLRRDWKSRKCN